MNTTKETWTTCFGIRRQRLRFQAQIETQRDLAFLMDLRKKKVSQWESGTHRPRAKDMLRLAHVVSITPEVLEKVRVLWIFKR
jgi:transcriptional regulator with XRE-family HTH domain